MKLFFYTSVLSLLLSTPIFGQTLSKKEAKELFKCIDNAFGNNNHQEVASCTNELLKGTYPLNTKAFKQWYYSTKSQNDLFLLGQCFNYYDSIQTYNPKSLELSSDLTSEIYKHKSLTIKVKTAHRLLRIKNHTEVERLLKECVSIDPSFLQPYLFLGLNEYDRENYLEALKWIDLADQKSPDVAFVLSSKANCFIKLNKPKNALNIFEKLESGGKLSNYTYYQISQCHSELGDFNKANSYIDKAINGDPTSEFYETEKVELLRKFGKHDEALELLIKYSKTADNKAKYYRKMYLIANQLSKNDIAINALNQLITLEPNRALNYSSLADYQETQSKDGYDKYISLIIKAIELEPDNAFYHNALGSLIYNRNTQQSEQPKFYQSLVTANKLNPSIYAPYLYMARYNLWKDKSLTKSIKSRAIDAMRNNISKDPSSSYHYYNLASAFDISTNPYGDGNKFKDSTLKYYNKVLELGYDSSFVISKRCYIYQTLGLYKESNKDFGYVVEHYTGHARSNSYFHMIDNYKRLKDYDNAKKIAQKAILEFPEKEKVFLERIKGLP